MSGIEFSIPLSIITTMQALGLSAQFLFDFKWGKKKAVSNTAIFGMLLLAFNSIRLIRGFDHSVFDSISFALLCGFISTLLFQNQIKTRIRFIIVSLTNALLFLLILALSIRIMRMDFFNQMLLQAVVLNVYFVLFSFITYFRFSNDQQLHIHTSHLAIGGISVACSFATLLWTDIQVYGLLTMNFLFVALIMLEYAKQFVFAESKQSDTLLNAEEVESKLEATKQSDILLNPEEVESKLEATKQSDPPLNPEEEKLKLEESLFEGYALTGREHEIAFLLLERLTQQQIADQLIISKSTVGTHIHAILRKTKTISRADFILKFKFRVPERQ